MALGKLATFAISILYKICDHFEISTGDIKRRKEAPYLSRIEQFLKQRSHKYISFLVLYKALSCTEF